VLAAGSHNTRERTGANFRVAVEGESESADGRELEGPE
jgi:hypothetical protein